VDGLKKRLPDSAKPLLTAASDLDQKLLSVRDDLIQAKVKANEDSLAYPQRVDSKLASVALVVSDGTDSAPTEAAIRQFAKLKQRADDVLARWAELQRTDLPAFQKLAVGQNIQAIVVPAAGSSSAGGGEEPR
jgi:CHASE3 domain sensor protein